MDTLRLQLLNEQKSPIYKSAHIALKISMKHQNHTVISSECASFEELKYHIDLLHKELNAIEEQGKKFFSKK